MVALVFREGDKVMQTKNNYQLEWEDTQQIWICALIKEPEFLMGIWESYEEINDFAETMTVVL